MGAPRTAAGVAAAGDPGSALDEASPATGRGPAGGGGSRSCPGARWRRRLRPVAGVAVAIGIWAALTSGGIVKTANLPTVGAVVTGVAGSWHSLLSGLTGTLESWAIGLCVAAVAGAALGLFVGLSRLAEASTEVIVRMMRPLPSLALIPVAILIAGLGVTMTAGLVAFAAFWPVFINSRYAVHQIEPRLLDTGRALGLRRWGLIRRVVLPAAAPAMATGLRISVGLAVVVTVSVELVAGTGGLGGYVLVAEQSGNIGQMYAGVIAGGILGWALNSLSLIVTRRLIPWEQAAAERAR